MRIQLLGSDDPSVEEDSKSGVHRWREYVDSYVLGHPTEWMSEPQENKPRSPIYLKRYVRKRRRDAYASWPGGSGDRRPVINGPNLFIFAGVSLPKKPHSQGTISVFKLVLAPSSYSLRLVRRMFYWERGVRMYRICWMSGRLRDMRNGRKAPGCCSST